MDKIKAMLEAAKERLVVFVLANKVPAITFLVGVVLGRFL